MSTQKVLLKVVILGDSGVGKTCIMNQFVTKKFSTLYKATIGADFMSKEIDVEGNQVNLQIWDTAGQERFMSLGVAFYRGSNCCVITFDVTNEQSFLNIEKWKDEFLLQCNAKDSENFPFILLGNKVDLDSRVITKQRAEEWCSKRKNIIYFETSAKDNLNINEAFVDLSKRALEYEKENAKNAKSFPEPINLNQTNPKNNNSCNC